MWGGRMHQRNGILKSRWRRPYLANLACPLRVSLRTVSEEEAFCTRLRYTYVFSNIWSRMIHCIQGESVKNCDKQLSARGGREEIWTFSATHGKSFSHHVQKPSFACYHLPYIGPFVMDSGQEAFYIRMAWLSHSMVVNQRSDGSKVDAEAG